MPPRRFRRNLPAPEVDEEPRPAKRGRRAKNIAPHIATSQSTEQEVTPALQEILAQLPALICNAVKEGIEAASAVGVAEAIQQDRSDSAALTSNTTNNDTPSSSISGAINSLVEEITDFCHPFTNYMEQVQYNGNFISEEITAPHSHIPCGEAGSGLYFAKVLDTLAPIKELTPIALDCVRSSSVTPHTVFTIADYGCADGGHSMPIIYSCVEELRKLHGNELEILVFYEDQPVNDFTSLFSFIQGLVPGPSSYLTAFPNIYVGACGTQFYKQCFPRGTVHLGLCCIAVHWLSKVPCSSTGGLYHYQSQNPKERELFTRQAADDWETFLVMRAKELASGGTLALVVFAEEDEKNWTRGKGLEITKVLSEMWKKMAKDGVITTDEVNKTLIAAYIRTRKELQLPFMSDESPVRKAGLSLTSLEIKTFSCPHAKLRQETGDVKKAAKSMAEEIRMWSNSSFLSGLSDDRTSEEKKMIVDEYFRLLEAEFVRSPEEYKMEFVAAVVSIKKA